MNIKPDKRFPFTPFPIGWYWIEFSEKLPVGKLLSKQWMGQSIVAWRDKSGKVCVANAVCPHLGARLSPEHGGKLEDGCLVCPFHGFRYNSNGQCVGSPHGVPKRTIELEQYEVRETFGVIFAFWHPHGEKPTWELPEKDQKGWSPFLSHTRVIRTHPQEVAENGVDAAHLSIVHNYYDILGGRTVTVDGPKLENKFTLHRHVGPTKSIGMTLNVQATVSIWGMGLSFIEPEIPEAGIYIRQLAMCTPIDGEYVDFVMALQLKDIGKPNVLLRGLGLVPQKLLKFVMHRLFFSIYKKDISQDFEIWENKQYLVRPRLNEFDGAILEYRRYCEQFHVAPELPSLPSVPENETQQHVYPRA